VSLKLILLGDGAVGKTTLVKSFMDQTFQSDYLMTVGIDISVKEIILKDTKRVKLTISDVAGQQRFQQFRSIFFSGANLAFLCFDVTRRDSLENLEREWLPQLIPTISDPNFQVLLVANKIDLEDQQEVTGADTRLVQKRFQKKFPMLHWVGYIETSALTKHNVQEAFDRITDEYFTTHEKAKDTSPIN
jgi:small GTP-binding protein